MKISLQDKKECYLCKNTKQLELHHIFYGTANRVMSTKYNLCVYLCTKHHRGSEDGVHFNKPYDIMLKQIAQEEFERVYSRDLFIKEFGKNWL